MAITDWPMDDRPREKLIKRGPQTLSDSELLAIFLRTGCAGKSAVDLARDLLNHFGDLRSLLGADINEFCLAQGLGPAKYAQLQAVLEMARRHLLQSIDKIHRFTSSDSVRNFLKVQLRDKTQEVFCGMFLDSQNQLITFEELFVGTLTTAAVYPREVVKKALKHHANSVIFAHNHPSGQSQPSDADIAITNTLKKALALIDIEVLDHFIVGNEVTSFADRGLI